MLRCRPLSIALLCAALFWCHAAAFAISTGAKAPNFTLRTISGARVSLSQFKNKVVYLDFWASWCAPCRMSMPWMKSLKERYGSSNFEVLAVSVDSNENDARAFVAEVAPNFTVLLDAKGVTPELYAISGMPSSFLIAPDGTVALAEQGFSGEGQKRIEQRIKELTSKAEYQDKRI